MLKLSSAALLQPFVFSDSDVANSKSFGHSCVEVINLFNEFYTLQEGNEISTLRHRVELKM